MNILGQEVKHKKFGKGVVTALSENKITVCFAGKEKLFLFPDAFPQYLVLKNESMQRKIEKLNEERTQKAEAKKKRIEQENRYRNQRDIMKIPLKSQVVYNIFEEDIVELEAVDAGCNLSGKMKGKPRIPVNMQPNSAILFPVARMGERMNGALQELQWWMNAFGVKNVRMGRLNFTASIN